MKTIALVIVLALTAIACGNVGSPTSPASVPAPSSPPSPARKPNIILVVTDDMLAADLPAMSQLQALANQGTTFRRAYAAEAVCAPSRASMLTGQYPQNSRVMTNATAIKDFTGAADTQTIPVWLSAAGYRTSLIGKYINGYDSIAGYVPPGWSEVAIPVPEENSYVQYTLFTAPPPKDYWYDLAVSPANYQTDVLSARAVDTIRRAGDQPFFLYIAPSAPHLPADPAPRHGGMFADAEVPQNTCAFNEQDLSDKPGYVQQRRWLPLDADEIRLINKVHRRRLQSLQAVDELITAVRAQVAAQHLENDTYLFFTSDNGWEQGEHRLKSGKNYPYEESIHMPLVVIGPGQNGRTVPSVVSTVDLASTFLELAGVPAPSSLDGLSLVPYLRGATPTSSRTGVLVQSHDENSFWEVRTERYMYTEYWDGERELYDMELDPYQCENIIASAPQSLVDDLHRQVVQLSTCRGASCR